MVGRNKYFWSVPLSAFSVILAQPPLYSPAKDLVSHLLCVDPSTRYTIDEFLAHPWCQDVQPPEVPTASQPPQRREAIGPLDSPLLQSLKGRDPVRSPGVAALKEAFDVTYAVHRMEEEGGQRHKGAGGRGFLGGLNESDEDENTDEGSIPQHQTIHAAYDMSIGGRAGARDQGPTKVRRRLPGAQNNSRGFDLNLDGATLLGRRHHRQPGVADSSLLAGQVPAQRTFGLGSPMRGVEYGS